jgi:hypothetical protein
VEELRRLRAAEESALTALADEELAARFNGDVTLTVRDEGVTILTPEQASAFPASIFPRLPAPACTSCPVISATRALRSAARPPCHWQTHSALVVQWTAA